MDKEVFAVGDGRCLGAVVKPLALCIRERLLGVFKAGVRHLVESVLVGCFDGSVVVALHGGCGDVLDSRDALAGHRVVSDDVTSTHDLVNGRHVLQDGLQCG